MWPLLVTCFFNLEHILRFTGAEDGYIETAVWYGRFVVISLIFQSFSQIVGAALIGYGNTKVIFKSNVVGNILNTIMNFFLIYGIGFFPELGVMGAGVSTMISSALIALLLLRTISQHTATGLTLRHPSKWTFERPVLHTMFHVGGSSLGEQFFERFWYVYIHHDCCFLRCSTIGSTLCMYELNGYILLLCHGSWFRRGLTYRSKSRA